ncbi:MAG: IS1380 family transposase [Ignavibacteriae bacterium]|nr:IS1380 family transposase [Ignavibacteriota bacterium]
MKNNISQKERINNQKAEDVREEFSGKNLTRFGGTGLIRRFFNRHSIKDEIEKRIKIEGRRECKYSAGSMIVSILYGIFLGYQRPSQMEVFTTDGVFQKIAGLIGFPVQSTISRFLSSLKVSVARELAALNFNFLMKFRGGFKAFKSITLDMDSHVIPVFGNQQRVGLGYNPKKKGRKSYHPLLCFIGETRDYIGGFLRSGKRHTSHNAIPFIKSIIKKLPSHIKEIRVRADSGFFSLDMLKFLINSAIEFYIIVPIQTWVQNKIMGIRNWRGIGYGVEVGEFEFILNRVITIRMAVIRQKVKVGESPKKQLKLLHVEGVLYDYQVIATNSNLSPEDVWRFYNKRACCENFIKEGIYGFGLDKVVSHSYAGNSAWFEVLMFAYNLMNFFKEEVMNQNKVKEMIQGIRERLFLIPGRLVYKGRQWILRLERTWFYRCEYEDALAKVT